MAAESGGRIVFDLSSAARWSGPPVGIVRAQRELAAWASAHVPNLAFAVFDARDMRFHHITHGDADAFITGAATLNLWSMPDATGARTRRSSWLPPLVYDLLQGRRTWLRVWERVRLGARRPWLSRLADRLQRPIITHRYAPSMLNPDGSRRPFPTPDMVLGDAVAFTAADTLLATGFGWSHGNMEAIAATHAATGFRFVVLCYDIIPLVLPQYFDARGFAQAERYWKTALAAADVVVANAQAVARDVEAFAEGAGLAPPKIRVALLGADPPRRDAGPAHPLPDGLKAGRYALFVSTIEPRKGHPMLHRVWRRLLAAGVPQAHDFKLVFVGRPGWMMGDFDATLAADADVAGSLLRLERVGDEALDQLYRQAAFCLYPSAYEGFGLPVVEAFARGKAVLASDGGALAEVAGGFSPVLAASDEDAWFAAIKTWIENPEARGPFEQAIRERFRHPTWDEAAARFFQAAGVGIV